MNQAQLTARSQQLLQTLQSRYPLEDVSLVLAGETFRLRLVSDVDALLDQLLAKGEAHEDVLDERIPYWADLWHSAIGLAEYVLAHPDIGPGAEVLELGCGRGLSGIAAGRKGASVILTDYLPEALQLAELLWLENLGRPAQCLALDWRQIDPERKVDWVLAADVAYEERNFAPLLAAFKTLLRPGGRILLSEPGRKIAQPFLDSFQSEGFRVKKTSRAIRWKGTLNTIGIYELSR